VSGFAGKRAFGMAGAMKDVGTATPRELEGCLQALIPKR
jgi:hypothetical protein